MAEEEGGATLEQIPIIHIIAIMVEEDQALAEAAVADIIIPIMVVDTAKVLVGAVAEVAGEGDITIIIIPITIIQLTRNVN